jgi:hypothetical protein
MDLFHLALQSWQFFFASVATASATLTGLLFVSLPMNRDRLRGEKVHVTLSIARNTFGSFLYVLMFALVFLVPHRVPYSLTVALIVLGVASGLGLIIHEAHSLAPQLRKQKIAVVSLTPGFLRSEEMLDHFGVTEVNWRDAISQDKYFAYSETPYYVGKTVVALACDKKVMQKSGKALDSGSHAREYGFTDIDGSQPVWSYWTTP